MSDKIEVGDTWFNEYQRLEVEIISVVCVWNDSEIKDMINYLGIDLVSQGRLL